MHHKDYLYSVRCIRYLLLKLPIPKSPHPGRRLVWSTCPSSSISKFSFKFICSLQTTNLVTGLNDRILSELKGLLWGQVRLRDMGIWEGRESDDLEWEFLVTGTIVDVQNSASYMQFPVKVKKHVIFYKKVDQEVNHVFYIVLNVLDCTRSYCWCVV